MSDSKARKSRSAADTALVAKRVNVKHLRSSLQEAFGKFWTIEGQPGLFSYVRGCKADHSPAKNEVVAKPKFDSGKANGDTLAVFTRDTDVEKLVLDAVGK